MCSSDLARGLFAKTAARSQRKQIAFVTALRTQKGRPVIDATDPMTLDTWQNMPVSVKGGGPDQFAYFPPSIPTTNPVPDIPDTTTAGQALLDIAPDGGVARCSDFVSHPAIGMTDGQDETPGDLPRTPSPFVTDAIVRHGGTSVIVGADGAVLVDVTGADVPVVRVQLPTAGKVRVFRDGEDADGLVLLSTFRVWAAQIEASIKALNVAMATAGTVAAGVNAPVVFTAPSLPDAATSPLASAVFAVSSASSVTP